MAVNKPDIRFRGIKSAFLGSVYANLYLGFWKYVLSETWQPNCAE